MSTTVVASFNVRTSRGLDGRNSWLFRRRVTATAIADLDADVVGLQEVRHRPLRYLRRALPDYDAVGVGRDDGADRGEHCSILFRRERYELVHHETRWFSDHPHVAGSVDWGNRPPRIVTFAVLRDRRDGSVIPIANAHLDARRADLRERSAERLAHWMPEVHDGQWVLLGDLNATVDEAPLRVLLRNDLHDALSMLPADGSDAATGHEFTGRHDGRRIDHILVAAGWSVDEAEIVRSPPGAPLASDHWPIRARLRRR